MSDASNPSKRRGRLSRKNIKIVQDGLANLGIVLTGEEITTVVSFYLEALVHEANMWSERPNVRGNPAAFMAVRQTAARLQWFADTATDGGIEMRLAGG